METIGQRIRRLRKARGLTQGALAAQAGVDQSTLSDIENGANFKVDVLTALCGALMKSPQYILYAEAAPFDLSDVEAQMVAAYRAAQPSKAALKLASSAPDDAGHTHATRRLDDKIRASRKNKGGRGSERHQN